MSLANVNFGIASQISELYVWKYCDIVNREYYILMLLTDNSNEKDCYL